MSDKQVIVKTDRKDTETKDKSYYKRNIGEEGGRFNDHEYHEITDDGVVSPRFETFDFGPSLMDEVFKELDIIKPEFTDDLNGQQKTINDCNSNVKNEIKEIVNKLTLNKDKSNKSKTTVKPISPAEEQNLDSAIAMAKELATLSMMEFEFKPVTELKSVGENSYSDSPRTPTSPNKKKFSFKFKNSPKVERKNFSEKAGNISDIQSMLTEEAKSAYSSLIEKGEGLDKSKMESDKRHLPSSHHVSGATITSTAANSVNLGNTNISQPSETDTIDLNPLRLLRNGFSIIPKVKGNKQRIAATPQTASLARLTANVNRSNLGAPPPPPAAPPALTNPTSTNSLSYNSIGSMLMGLSDDNSQQNALPLPPRDRTKQLQPACLKQHQRKHPLILPGSSIGPISGPISLDSNGSYDISSPADPPMSTFKPHLPAMKHGLSNEAQPSYVNYVPPRGPEISDIKYSSPASTMSPKRNPVPNPPPKPNRSFLNEEPLESKHPTSTASVDNHASVKPTQQFNETKTYDGVTQPPIKTSSINCRVSPLDYTTSAANKPSLVRTIDSKEPDPDEVRVMQKVLANEIQLSTEECIKILRTTGCDIHKAIKCVRLRETLKSHSIDIDCNWAEMLARFNWNMRQASNYLIATQGLPEDTTEV
ncbi:tyrosine-protein kinase PR2 isoform X1 [Tetranychus urticae]|uniref:tyrosine-protein kinase PR2 isoform X1 n=1 Tax=Tetranychus urticae TaxID=32264 RepID=UPI00077BEE5B|nr:tyrosine-protein kinase PR2 isoform X1 [Tetranychus urticae]